jgi:hypothetical protein
MSPIEMSRNDDSTLWVGYSEELLFTKSTKHIFKLVFSSQYKFLILNAKRFDVDIKLGTASTTYDCVVDG